MNKEFTKADLKNGMVVEYRDRDRRLVIDKYLIGKNSHYDLREYNENLENSYPRLTIMKVFKICQRAILGNILDDCNLELIWERKETKEMTVEEMRQKLEDLTGDKIEVKASRYFMLFRLNNYCDKHNCTECIFGENRFCHFHRMSNAELEKAYKEMMQHEHDNGIK